LREFVEVGLLNARKTKIEVTSRLGKGERESWQDPVSSLSTKSRNFVTAQILG
jgi:hypothetical protein